MKKLITILFVVLTCSVLSGCSKNETSSENPASTIQETEGNTEESRQMESESDIELPEDFVSVTKEQLKSLPDTDNLVNTVSVALESIGVREIENTAYGNYEKIGSMLMVDIYAVTDLRKLIIKTQNLNVGWDVIYIVDAENGNLFYPVTGKNAYDYISGECINPEKDEDGSGETGNLGVTTQKVSRLEINGEKIVDVTIRDIKKYDYIKDVYISVDESNNEIDITVQISFAENADTAKMAGEDVARYLAAMAGNANSSFKLPGNDDLGGIYDKYDLLIYVDGGNENFSLYGAKVTTSNRITWSVK